MLCLIDSAALPLAACTMPMIATANSERICAWPSEGVDGQRGGPHLGRRQNTLRSGQQSIAQRHQQTGKRDEEEGDDFEYGGRYRFR